MHKLESLDVWKVSHSTAVLCYRVTLTPPLKHHFAAADQIRRAAVSIPANIAEGYGLYTRPQLIRHLRIALASAYELRTHLEIMSDVGLLTTEDSNRTTELVNRTIRLLIGTLRGLERKRD
jgi:four helix bundle protein